MKFTKKAAILTASYAAAAFAVLGGFTYLYKTEAAAYRLGVENSYQHAFSELVNAVSELDSAMQKCSYSKSVPAVTSTCTDVFGKAMSAQMALGMLPFENNELENTASFISKVGDYAYYLSKTAADGQDYSDEEYNNLRELSKTASSLSNSLQALYEDMSEGRITMQGVEKAEAELSFFGEDSADTLSDSYKVIESEFPEIPSLIYDGPFSAHLENESPKMLEGSDEVSSKDAIKIAAEFLNCGVKELEESGSREGELPVLAFVNGDRTVEVTKQGGKVIYYKDNGTRGEGKLSGEDAISTGIEFLKKQGYETLKPTYWTEEDGHITVNFAHSEEEVMCYPDLIKVAVAVDTGEVVGFEAKGYIMNHKERALETSELDPEASAGNISRGLSVNSSGIAVIPTSGRNEILCYEHKCENEDGRQYIVYVNTETGNQEKILMLIEDENGTLVK